MDLALIEKLLDLPRVKVNDISITNEEILVHIFIPPGNHRCPQCSKYHSKVTERTEIKVRDLSIFGYY